MGYTTGSRLQHLPARLRVFDVICGIGNSVLFSAHCSSISCVKVFLWTNYFLVGVQSGSVQILSRKPLHNSLIPKSPRLNTGHETGQGWV